MKDENETAFDAILQTTEDLTGPEILADIIGSLREGMEAGFDDGELALRLWPRLARVVNILGAEKIEELNEGFRRWQDTRHNPAAELGRRGGKKGGPARAKSLSADERSEIASVAAKARWKKAREGAGDS